jgi:hypothetical protein
MLPSMNYRSIATGIIVFLLISMTPTAVRQVQGDVGQIVFEDDFEEEPLRYNATSLTKWTVTDGNVDVIGQGVSDFYPGNGHYLDLDGTCGSATIQSVPISLAPGTYHLSFLLGDNLDGRRLDNGVDVSFGTFFRQSYAAPLDLTTTIADIVVPAAATASLVFRETGPSDCYGTILDAVALTFVSTPAPAPTITSVDPVFGTDGMTIDQFVVTGTNFQLGATLAFSGTGIKVTSPSNTATSLIATVNIAADALAGFRDVTITNPDAQFATKQQMFKVLEPFQISAGLAYESFVAVDPADPNHAVVAFNGFSSDGSVQCAWTEFTNPGQPTPDPSQLKRGTLRFPARPSGQPQWKATGDPWVQFGPDGKLWFSCIGELKITATVLTRGVFVARSNTQFAADLNTVTTRLITSTVRRGDVGEQLDRPSIALVKRSSDVTRLVACWQVDRFDTALTTAIRVAYSDYPNVGPPSSLVQQTLDAGNVKTCEVGSNNGLTGTDARVAVSWWDALLRDTTLDDRLNIRISTDGGVTFAPVITLPGPLGPLNQVATVGSTTGRQLFGTLTTIPPLLSMPYALITPGVAGLRAVWQSGTGTGPVLFGELPDPPLTNVVAQPLLSPEGSGNQFLPGGHCNRLIGAYEITGNGGVFRYKVWLVNGNELPRPILTSNFDLAAAGGVLVPNDLNTEVRRIGEYTGTDCVGHTGWATWTDVHNGFPEIWGAVVPLP